MDTPYMSSRLPPSSQHLLCKHCLGPMAQQHPLCGTFNCPSCKHTLEVEVHIAVRAVTSKPSEPREVASPSPKFDCTPVEEMSPVTVQPCIGSGMVNALVKVGELKANSASSTGGADRGSDTTWGVARGVGGAGVSTVMHTDTAGIMDDIAHSQPPFNSGSQPSVPLTPTESAEDVSSQAPLTRDLKRRRTA